MTESDSRIPLKFIASVAVIALVGLPVILGSWYTIDQGERGVITRFGAVVGTADPGLGFKTPFVTVVTRFPVQTQIIKIEDTEAYSQDQQPAHMQLSVNYSITPSQVVDVYSQFGSAEGLADRLIRPRIQQQVKNVFGHYTAATAISQRDKLNTDIRQALSDSVKGPVMIEGVQLENIKFSKPYEEAIEARMTAEVEVQKSAQKAQNEKQLAQITVTKAQADADSQLALATAQAKAITLRGEADANAIRAKGEALRDNPALIQYQAIGNGWDGKLPTSMTPGGALPFIGVR
ncbi:MULTISPECIES: prohibitin family protein [unclassified Rhizobium]|uniref:prohibitin family protein n=1 Tax=unclassified Rhizobium TaxID=2613769 RepID=UPI001ADC5D16|nr:MULTISPECIES: prohibitin family protein [unclassified Rhizobium]MBO9097216.1 prohibitin family protein [Rhizobium sp. L58/93]MBO9133933.1 prohibitin family protein [Rhizobium sp. B209b/85]MBO9167454.1 prohibitin family protein [Rhizobium sp. L245/93]MBO9183413.1 prohibitin family protein [Rhizobium sp. E27B/91]QXZ83749.1 prohibitin family protein [Rhizobium sp. K1/93]